MAREKSRTEELHGAEREVLSEFTADGSVKKPDEVAAELAEGKAFAEAVRPIDDVGDYKSEDEDPNVLIHGPWLERGGSAFWISTAGTGKSIGSVQLAHAMSAGMPFCGLRPRVPLKFWIFQSEDSPRRVAQDRIDVRAELAERYSDIDWEKVGKTVMMAKLTGKVGVAFLAELDRLLALADKQGAKPDVLILNPLLAFVGGPITDGSYVTPFLRGGTVDGKDTDGLQAILERHGVGVIVFHHTPKPPTEKEIDAWMKSPFPEYQGAGTSDITNWGRSFVTMMRVKGHANMVCVTAGKNGAELGWERVGGAYRRYMAYSDELGISGKGRHAWRELTPDEYEEVVSKAKDDFEKKSGDAIDEIVAEVKRRAMTKTEIGEFFAGRIARAQIRLAIATIFATPIKFGLTVRPVLKGRAWTNYIGQAEGLRKATGDAAIERKYEEAMEEKRRAEAAQKAENRQNVDPVEPTVAPTDGQSATENAQEDQDGWY